MYEGDLLPVVGLGVLEGVAAQPLRARLRHDLERLDDAGHVLVLQHGVLALRVLPDDRDVHVVVPRLDPRLALAAEIEGKGVILS